jgi:hypothetical protein
MMGVLQAPPTADPEWPNVGAPGPSRLPVPPRPLASLKVFFVFEWNLHEFEWNMIMLHWVWVNLSEIWLCYIELDWNLTKFDYVTLNLSEIWLCDIKINYI